MAEGVTQVTEHLHSKCKALSSMQSTTKKENTHTHTHAQRNNQQIETGKEFCRPEKGNLCQTHHGRVKGFSQPFFPVSTEMNSSYVLHPINMAYYIY
jgi:hypothetical protein